MPSVLLVRHALSQWNVEGRWQGQADPPLSEQGEAQARAAAVGTVDLVVSSDLERARRTAAILAPGIRHVAEPLLREFDVGAWSGHTRAAIEREWGRELALFDAGGLESPPGGERRADFEVRVLRAAARICELVVEASAHRTVVVTHGGVIRTLARLEAWPDRHVGHLCGYEAEVKDGSLVLLEALDLLSGAPTGGEIGGGVIF